ncbi:MAG: hypothetical protein AMS15_06560 [Planctomycetes bacterium DG_23]|nr:MAG: hypothetical protein AMS15_06560 [Planctomycetes bacterium DG_23]
MATVIYFVEYLLLRLSLCILAALPFPLAHRIGEMLGRLVYLIDHRHRLVVLKNLDIAYGNSLPYEEKLGLARKSYEHLFKAGIELVFAPRLVNKYNWQDYFELDNLPELLKMVWAGKGGIYITAHFGIWELLGCIVPYIGLPVYAIARPIENPFVDRYLNKMRQITGQKVIPKKEASSGVMDVLENGGFLSFLVDQNAGTRGIFVDFFGKPASTTRTVALLSLKTGVPLIPVYAYRIKGFKFKVVIETPIYPVDTGNPTADIESMTQALTKRVERWARMYPAQYLWQHRRWKTRPPWEKPGMLEVGEKLETISAASS